MLCHAVDARVEAVDCRAYKPFSLRLSAPSHWRNQSAAANPHKQHLRFIALKGTFQHAQFLRSSENNACNGDCIDNLTTVKPSPYIASMVLHIPCCMSGYASSRIASHHVSDTMHVSSLPVDNTFCVGVQPSTRASIPQSRTLKLSKQTLFSPYVVVY